LAKLQFIMMLWAILRCEKVSVPLEASAGVSAGGTSKIQRSSGTADYFPLLKMSERHTQRKEPHAYAEMAEQIGI
jgi:hypothetical protein